MATHNINLSPSEGNPDNQGKAAKFFERAIERVGPINLVEYRQTVDSEEFVQERIQLAEMELTVTTVEDLYFSHFKNSMGTRYFNRNLFNSENWILFHSEKYCASLYFQSVFVPHIFSNFGEGLKTISRELSSGTIEKCIFIKTVELYVKGLEKNLKLWETANLIKIQKEIDKFEYIFFNSPDFKKLEAKLKSLIMACPILKEKEHMEQQLALNANLSSSAPHGGSTGQSSTSSAQTAFKI